MNNGHNEGRNSGTGISFEDSLRRDTPTQAQIANRERSQHEGELRNKARNAVDSFKSLCKETANSGNRSCWSYAMSMNDLNTFMWVYWSPIRSVEPPYFLSDSRKIDTYDAPHFVDLISEELKREGFSSAQVYIADKILRDFMEEPTTETGSEENKEE